jgi:cytochrome c-type biogenesis protein
MMVADAVRGVNQWWGPALAFAAGVVSFASPCVLPLVPGYLSFVTAGQDPAERRPLAPILLFILGFSVVFTFLFGFTASAARDWFLSSTGRRVAGALVLLFGLFMILYAFRAKVPWLYREGRPFLTRVKPGRVWAFPLGMAFAVGWTPCIGPVLGSVSTLAFNQGTTFRVVFLLFMYSMGLGLPFLLVGLGVGRLMHGFRFISRNYHWFAGVSGVVMVAIGILVVSGQWSRVIAPLLNLVRRFSPVI